MSVQTFGLTAFRAAITCNLEPAQFAADLVPARPPDADGASDPRHRLLSPGTGRAAMKPGRNAGGSPWSAAWNAPRVALASSTRLAGWHAIRPPHPQPDELGGCTSAAATRRLPLGGCHSAAAIQQVIDHFVTRPSPSLPGHISQVSSRSMCSLYDLSPVQGAHRTGPGC